MYVCKKKCYVRMRCGDNIDPSKHGAGNLTRKEKAYKKCVFSDNSIRMRSKKFRPSKNCFSHPFSCGTPPLFQFCIIPPVFLDTVSFARFAWFFFFRALCWLQNMTAEYFIGPSRCWKFLIKMPGRK